MNIIYFTNYFPPHIGAASIYTYKIIDYLAKKGHKILVFTRGSQAPTSKLIDKKKQFFHENISVIYSNSKIRHPYSSLISHIENYFIFFKKYYHRFKPDLVMSQYHTFHFAPIVGAILSRQLQIPHVVRSHDIFSPFYGKMRKTGSLLELIYIKIVNHLTYKSIKYTDLFYTTTSEQRIHLIKDKKFRKTIFKTHPNGIDPSIFFPKVNNKLKIKFGCEKLILYIGMLDLDLGVQEFLQSLPLINAKDKKTHFLIIGSGKDENYIKNFITMKNLQDVVHLFPPISHAQIPYYINNCDFGIGFLADDLFYKYCIPVKCIEYMACEKTFITTPVSRDIIWNNNTGLLIKKLNSKEISKMSIKLLRDNELRINLSKEGYRLTQTRFNWENLMNNFEKEIKLLVFRRR